MLSTSQTLSAWHEPKDNLGGATLMEHLFDRLDGLYPIRWRSAFASEQAIKNWGDAWANGFEEEGVTLAEVRLGLRACRTQFDWPPSFAEFLKACRPPIYFVLPVLPRIEPPRWAASQTIDGAQLIDDMSRAVASKTPANGIAWAHKIIDRHHATGKVPFGILEIANRAIKNFKQREETN